MSDKVIYLDFNATTPLAPEVFDAMEPYLRGSFANAASSHALGRDSAFAVELARAQIAELVGAQPQEIVFTSGATESNNLALIGAAAARPDHRHVVTVATEHKAILDPAAHLARRGFEVTVLPVDRTGMIDPEQVRSSLRTDTLLVSVMAANNETGTTHPLDEIAGVCHDAGVILHSDAAQLVGKLPIDLGAMPADLISLTAHKMYGPKGVGALCVRRGTPLEPLFFGGGHERGLRSGTMNVPGIVGFGAAAGLALARMAGDASRCAALRIHLLAALKAAFPGTTENGHRTRRLPGTLNVRLPGIDADELQAATPGVAISSGSACTSATPEPSHVLRAMGLDWQAAQECLRFGVGRPTTVHQIDEAVTRLSEGASRLSDGSTLLPSAALAVDR